MERTKLYKKNPRAGDHDLHDPNLKNYDQVYSHFSWVRAERSMTGPSQNKELNIAYEAVDRHAQGDLKDHIALRWLGKKEERKEFTYEDLRRLSNQFANVLKKIQAQDGDVVFTLTGRVPELYVAAPGTWKNKNVFCPLFSAFEPEPMRSRLSIAKAKFLITTEELYLKKVMPIRNSLPDLQHVILIDHSEKNKAP